MNTTENFYAFFYDGDNKFIGGWGLPSQDEIVLPKNTFTIELIQNDNGKKKATGLMTLDKNMIHDKSNLYFNELEELQNHINAINDTYYEYKLENDFVRKLEK